MATAIRKDTNVTADLSVTADFTINTYTVNSSVSGGYGTISPTGEQAVNHGETRQFTLTAENGYHPGAILGTCGGTLSGNTFTTNAVISNCTVIATFTDQYTLGVVIDGTGLGNVFSTPAGIDGCTADCSADFPPGTHVILSAVADSKSKFEGWSGGDCTGTSDCTLIMDQAREITATFNGKSSTYLFLIINSSKKNN